MRRQESDEHTSAGELASDYMENLDSGKIRREGVDSVQLISAPRR